MKRARSGHRPVDPCVPVVIVADHPEKLFELLREFTDSLPKGQPGEAVYTLSFGAIDLMDGGGEKLAAFLIPGSGQ